MEPVTLSNEAGTWSLWFCAVGRCSSRNTEFASKSSQHGRSITQPAALGSSAGGGREGAASTSEAPSATGTAADSTPRRAAESLGKEAGELDSRVAEMSFLGCGGGGDALRASTAAAPAALLSGTAANIDDALLGFVALAFIGIPKLKRFGSDTVALLSSSLGLFVDGLAEDIRQGQSKAALVPVLSSAPRRHRRVNAKKSPR